MCVPAIANGVGKAASFMVSPAASIIGALGNKKKPSPSTSSTSTSASGSGY